MVGQGPEVQDLGEGEREAGHEVRNGKVVHLHMAQWWSPALVSGWEKGQEQAQEGNREVTGQQGWGEQRTASSVPGEEAGGRAGKGCS